MAANFAPERAEAIEHALVAHVQHHTTHRKHRTAWTAGLLLTGALAGAGASAGAFAATGMLQPASTQIAERPSGEATPDLPDAVTAPMGVTPGMPVVALLDEPLSVTVDGAAEVPLSDRPAEATHARVTVTATAPGGLAWGTDPGGNNPTAGWTAADVADGPSSPAWYDFPLDASVDTLYLDPTGFTGVATIQYVTHVPTLFGINANGQTYGASGTSQGEPDLIAVQATNDELGYVSREEFDEATGANAAEHFTSPEDALEWQERNRGTSRMLPVYLSDGVTTIGEFRVGGP